MERLSSELVLRLGLAFAFAFPAIDGIFEPYSWIGYFPSFMRGYVPDPVLLHGFGVFELAIALWLIIGWRVRYAAALAAVVLVAIVVLDYRDFSVLFRDLSIASMGLALVLLPDRRTL